jgi:sirohydrochlorin cobaltochelatase
MTQICIIPVYLFTGVLIERIKNQVDRLKQQYPGISFALGAHFGFDKGIFDLLDSKVSDGDLPIGGLLECDGCKYREAAEAEHLHDHSHTATGGCGSHHAHDDRAHAHDHSPCQHAHG